MPQITPGLLALLRCPVTKSSLRQDEEELVACEPRNQPGPGEPRYRIVDGIPVLLPPDLPVSRGTTTGAGSAADAAASDGRISGREGGSGRHRAVNTSNEQ